MSDKIDTRTDRIMRLNRLGQADYLHIALVGERDDLRARLEAAEAERDRLREALQETVLTLEKDARDMATAFGVTDWRETAPHTADITSRARAALAQKDDGGGS